VNAELMEGVGNFRPLSGKGFQFFVIRALERLSTQMQLLLGNGQEGIVQKLGGRLRKVETQLAACAAVKKSRGCRCAGRARSRK
jgi:hypothetical protein